MPCRQHDPGVIGMGFQHKYLIIMPLWGAEMGSAWYRQQAKHGEREEGGEQVSFQEIHEFSDQEQGMEIRAVTRSQWNRSKTAARELEYRDCGEIMNE